MLIHYEWLKQGNCSRGINKTVFCSEISVIKNECSTINQRRGNYGKPLVLLEFREPSQICMEKLYIVYVLGAMTLVSCNMSCSNHTTTPDSTKLLLYILLWHRSKPIWKHSFPFLSYLPYSPDIAYAKDNLFRSMEHGFPKQHFT